MIRKNIAPRPDWRDRVEEDGLVWHTTNGDTYWAEGTYYSFTRREIAEIEKASTDCYELFLRAGETLARDNGFWLEKFGIPEAVWPAIRETWNKEVPCLNYGRFDFGYAGFDDTKLFDGGSPKLFEFNCDTPTSLLEASVIQWNWKEQVFPRNDQFNSIHENLVGKWADIRALIPDQFVHFFHAMDNAGEDMVTVGYMRDTAEEAGLKTSVMLVDDIGVDIKGRLLDGDERVMKAICKLYPWEWIVHEEYAKHIIKHMSETLWIEPIWKMLWSNKAILPLLWELAPDHPNLLRCQYVEPTSGRYVKKPFLSREGANTTIVDHKKAGGVVASTGGHYGEEGYIYQDLYDLPEAAPGVYPVIGSWIIDGEPSGMGIREDGLITSNTARFVPHVIEE